MKTLSELCISIEPLIPQFKVADVGDIFLDSRYDRFLSLPVVKDGRPVGTISRSHVQQIFMSRFGRELYGNKPIAGIMNSAPLVVSISQPVEEASRYITRNISFPITKDGETRRAACLRGRAADLGKSGIIEPFYLWRSFSHSTSDASSRVMPLAATTGTLPITAP